MSKQPHQERSLVVLKPDAVQRSLIGEIIRRFERTGLKCVGMKMFRANEEMMFQHYNKNEEWFLKKGAGVLEDLKAHGLPIEKDAMEYGKDIIRANAISMCSAPVIAMVWEGNEAIAVIKKITGTTEPSTSDVGTIRGDYTVDSYAHSALEQRAVRNLLHCSDEPTEAEREIKLWFKPEELMDYVTAQERIMYDVNFDNVKD